MNCIECGNPIEEVHDVWTKICEYCWEKTIDPVGEPYTFEQEQE